MALVPWPKTGPAQDNAVAMLKALLGRDPGNDSRLKQIACVVSDRISRVAPNAPPASKDEALTRGVAYFLDVETGAETRKSVGDETTQLASPAIWFVRSGAGSILRDYIVRRAGIV